MSAGALNETELEDFIREGILASQVGQKRAVATEAEQEKDAFEERLAQEKVKQHNELWSLKGLKCSYGIRELA